MNSNQYIYVYVYIYFGIVCGVSSGASSKNEVWSPAGCPYFFFADLRLQGLAKTPMFQNKMDLSIFGHTPICLGLPNTLMPETTNTPGHPKCEIVKTQTTPHKLRWILEGVAVMRQSGQHSGLTQTSGHIGQTHILICSTCSHHTRKNYIHIFTNIHICIYTRIRTYKCTCVYRVHMYTSQIFPIWAWSQSFPIWAWSQIFPIWAWSQIFPIWT